MSKEIQTESFKKQSIALIHKFRILEDLTEAELTNLLDNSSGVYMDKIARLVQYEAGETVIREGEFGSWVFWVLKGEYAVKKQGVIVTSFNQPGEVFGEMSALDTDMRTASVIAMIEGICFSLDLSILDVIKNTGIKSKIRNGIQRLKSKRLTLTTKNYADEKLKIMEQQREIDSIKIKLRAKELELQKREKALLKRERLDHS